MITADFRQRVSKDPERVNPNKLSALYKIILLGDSGVGKTSLLLRYCSGLFNYTPMPTIGLDFKIKTV